MPNPTKTNSEHEEAFIKLLELVREGHEATVNEEEVEEYHNKLKDFLAHQQSLLLDKVKEIVSGNFKGAFIDDGGSECWYVDDLLQSLDSLIDKK